MMDGRERGRQLRDAIFKAYEEKAETRRPNGLRPSELGGDCERHLWIRYRWGDKLEPFAGRMLRLFETGHLQEDRLVDDLRTVGSEVIVRDPNNPGQQIPIKLMEGHSKGFLDGVGNSIPFSTSAWVLVECKTHNEKWFKQVDKHGVEKAMPKHFAQMQLYMHEHSLKEALYHCVGKNDDDLYCEFVPYNPVYAARLVEKAERIVFSDVMPPKIHESPSFFKCKMCSSADVCHTTVLLLRTCRTCVFGQPMRPEERVQMRADGFSDKRYYGPIWYCSKGDTPLTLDEQKHGCNQHRYHPDWIKGEFLNAEDGVHRYQQESGEILADDGSQMSTDTVSIGTISLSDVASGSVHYVGPPSDEN